MEIGAIVASAIAVLSALYWAVSLLAGLRTIASVPLLRALEAAPPARWPLLSVIIPARNEATTIEAALASRIATDYPAIEFIVVDDRSTDATGAIIDRFAAADPRVRAIHVKELPDGWLGKVHALDVGFRQARGEWLLFSDADVHIAPEALRTIVAWCEEQGVDHCPVLPELWSRAFLLDTAISAFACLLAANGRMWAVKDQRSKAAAGVGAFNLVRRSAFERTEGFAWLKLEAIDDMGLGLMLKRSGGRAAVVNGRGSVGLEFYHSFADLARGCEKNVYGAMGGYRFLPFLATMALLGALNLGYLLAFVPPAPAWMAWVGFAGLGCALATSAAMNVWLGRRLFPALFSPIGEFLFFAVMFRAGWIGWRRGGIRWRETFYSSKVLRSGIRVKFPG